MNVMRALRALGPIDLQSVRRDSLLRWIGLYPLLIALVIRWGVPALATQLAGQYGFDLTPYYGLGMSFMIELMPLLSGMVVGFLLLDQRDDQTLTALQVTPLTVNGYLTYRIAVPMLLSVVTTILVFPIAGLINVALIPLVLMALGAAPLAPIYALFLASFAENKVQGFALVKGAGVIMVPPVIAYFVPANWQLVFGLIPTYWPAKAFWALQAGDINYGFYLLVGLAYQWVLLALLLGRFNQVMRR
jgi:fluoroquinolone transport system permease protein